MHFNNYPFFFQILFISKGEEIRDELIRFCINPDSMYSFLTDSNFTYNEVMQSVKSDSVGFVSHDDFTKYKEFFTDYFTKNISIILDTTVITKWNQALRFGKIRYIVLQGSENKNIYFLLVKDLSKWKAAAFFDEEPLDLNEINKKHNNAKEILDRILKNPYTLLNYVDEFKNSQSKENFTLDKYKFINWRNKQKFIEKNYYGGYSIEKEFSEVIGHENKNIIHKFYFVNNNDRKKPIKFEFIYNDSLNSYFLYDLKMYRIFDNDRSFYGKKVYDTLSSKEVEKNWQIVNLIVKNPDTLKVLLYDSLLVEKNFGKDTVFQNNLINYIKTYFKDGYIFDWDIPIPLSDDRFVFSHTHNICLSDKNHIRKLYFEFYDVDDLYNFKLNSVNSHLKEIDGIGYSGEMGLAFAMFATSVQELISIADAGKIMPPKSTWFEPKLRDGLFVHFLD